MKDKRTPISWKMIDFVPALSGLIGKTALVTSFALMWASHYRISDPDFVFENVRLEMIIGSIITLLVALFFHNIAPSGTLAPLIVLIPSMAAFGVHPFILSISVGVIGILGIKTKLFHKVIALSGLVSKTSLTLTIGLSGVLLSIKNLYTFFIDRHTPFHILLIILSLIYLILFRMNKAWLIVPIAAVLAVFISYSWDFTPDFTASYTYPSFDPFYWWNQMWGIGFGFDPITILKTIPFAFFVILLWAVDTISINTMLEANASPGEKREEIDLDRSILVASTRNIIGGIFGGAQTSALWRSFLIPLFMIKRPLKPASILLGILGILAGFTSLPVKLLSFSPLIWCVLLFGIFLPFVLVGLTNLCRNRSLSNWTVILASALLGVFISPIITWLSCIIYERIRLIQAKRRT